MEWEFQKGIWRSVNLVNAHAATLDTSPDVKDFFFYEALANTLWPINIDISLFFLGDLNARVGNQQITGLEPQAVMGGKMNENGQRLLEFHTISDLAIKTPSLP